jgi:lipoate-protein ligase A
MRIDGALLEDVLRSGNAFLRLYCWDPPTLSIGRNQQNVFRHMPVVRRPTGGQAVWHEHEVTYAVAAPIALYGSLRNAYCQIHTHIATALRSMGVAAVLAPTAKLSGPLASLGAGSSAACFAAPVGGEILVGGRKVVGSAQVRKRDAFLQHGSILVDGSQEVVSNAGGETTLTRVLGRRVTFDEIASAVMAHWPPGRQTARPSVIASAASG